MLASTNKLYGYNTSMVSSMFQTATSRVKLYRNDLRGTKNSFELWEVRVTFVARVQIIWSQQYVGLNDLNIVLFMYMYLCTYV